MSTILYRFNSPQRVKAKCFAVFASSLGSLELSSVPISTNSAAADSLLARQIISASASTFMGYALYQAQLGLKSTLRKTPAWIWWCRHSRDSRRSSNRYLPSRLHSEVPGLVYVLHAFQKKSKKGGATPKSDVELIKRRFNAAQDDYKARSAERGRAK